MHYEELINKKHPLKRKIDKKTLRKTQNLYQEEILLEEETYQSYLKLKNALLKERIEIGLMDGYRTIMEQQKIWKDYLQLFGEDYTKKYVAPPGSSEHHTGLAIDIGIIVDGKIYQELDEIETQKEILQVIFRKLKDYGFILRYPKGKESITGYAYEPWHFRYVGKHLSNYLCKKNITLEEYYEEKM